MSEPRILDGKAASAKIGEALAARVAQLGRAPRLAILRVGEDPRSAAYIARKRAFGREIGAEATLETLPATATQAELEAAVVRLGADAANDGVLVQLPAASLDGYAAAALVPAAKDIDGLAPGTSFVPATARGAAALLEAYGIPIARRRVAVVGQSRVAGAPIAALARAAGAEVSVADIGTLDLAAVTRPAEIVFSAAGKPGLLTAGHLAPGAVVVDVGTTSGPDGRLLGDLAPEARAHLAAYSPVPGGAGPMTVAALFQNLLDAALARR